MNTTSPQTVEAKALASDLSEKYGVPAIPVNCAEIDEKLIKDILAAVLYRFPVKQIGINLPGWVVNLNKTHWLRESLFETVKASAGDVCCVGDVGSMLGCMNENEYIVNAEISDLDLGRGCAEITVVLSPELVYKIIEEKTGLKIENDEQLMENINELSDIKHKYNRIKNALEEDDATGYGIVMPDIDELTLKEPEIVKQGG